MGIEALPSATVLTIGATQVLTDPASVVKELIDNALDAKCTSISVEIHNNTLDSIQVRDNGHGIPAEDRRLVARPHCTSKITGEDDLKIIGGSSLGFRGEALASAAEMSGSLTISTRVEGEEVATALKINQQGEVFGQDRASLPVGTTVKITNFIKSHPVRRQVALKNAEKTVAKIKQTLKSYAFARPHVRLSLRVLKAKNDKDNWTYAPKPGGNAEDAAFKILGAACASQCIWSVIEEQGYILQAFLAKPDAEFSKYSNIGPFVSIDQRPVSTARGTPKQILKIYREALKNANSRAAGVKDPFLFLSIQCPSASYDANVEPAKDDVLFETPDVIVGLVRRLFEAAYPSVKEAIAPIEAAALTETPRHLAEEDDFVTSLEPARPADALRRDAVLWTPFQTNEVLPIAEDGDPRYLGKTFRSNMYGCDEEDLGLLDEHPLTGHTEADLGELRRARRDVNVSNPWIIARMNASARRRPDGWEEDEEDNAGSRSQIQSVPRLRMSEAQTALPTPEPSSPMKTTTMASHLSQMPNVSPTTDGRSMGPSMLPPAGLSSVPPRDGDIDGVEAISEPQPRQAIAYNYVLPALDETQASTTPLRNIPNASHMSRANARRPRQHAQSNRPFKPPMRDRPAQDNVWFDHLEHVGQRRPPKRTFQARDNEGLVMQGELGDLADDPCPLTPPRRNRDMRDFLTAKDHSVQRSIGDLIEARQYSQRRRTSSAGAAEDLLNDIDAENCQTPSDVFTNSGFLPASELAAVDRGFGPLKPTAAQPLKRRKTSERQALGEITGNAPRPDNPIEDGNSAVIGARTTPLRRRITEGSTSKPRRTKSSRLPLERVPKGQGTHSLILQLSKSMAEVSSIAGKIDEHGSLLAWNHPSSNSYDVLRPAFSDQTAEAITAKLQELLVRHVPEGEMVQDLDIVVQRALTAHAQATLEVDASSTGF